MNIVKCPKCSYGIEINISNAIDELGETYECPHCGWKFKYTE